MRTARLTLSACIVSLSLASLHTMTADAAILELRNDSFMSGQVAGFQAGFAAGEIGAVRLDPPAGGPHQVLNVSLLFGGDTSSQTVTLTIWQDNGTVNPGAQIFSADYMLMGANDAFNVIDLSGDNVYVNGPFRVGITFQHSGVPSIARDTDGTINAPYNFIMAQMFGWVQSSLLGLTGDWVIRATIDDNSNPGVDAGVTPDAAVTPDAYVPDANVADANVADANVGPDAPVSLPDAAVPTPDAGSDQTCRVHSECPTGQYCNANDICDYDCRVDFDCGADMRCTSLGQCEADPGQGGGGCSTSGDDGRSHAPLGLAVLALFLLFRSRRRAAGSAA